MYPGGVYKPKNLILNEFEQYFDIVIPQQYKLYDYFAIFDLETICRNEDRPSDTDTIRYKGTYVAVSVSIASNFLITPFLYASVMKKQTFVTKHVHL